jgi:hypothetical protein
VHGPPIREQDAVRVDEEVTYGGFAEQLVDAGDVAAFAQPHAARAMAEVLLVQVGGDVDLGADVRPVAIHEREEGVRPGRRDDLDAAGLLQQPERAHQIAFVAAPGVAQRLEAVVVHVRQPLVVRFGLRAFDLAFGELDQLVQVLRVAELEQVVGEHRDQRR